MLPPLDDVDIMNATVRDNGTMTYTLLDGHQITADLGGEEPNASTIIAWCENVREISLARQQAKEEEKVEVKVPTMAGVAPSPIDYATSQVQAMEIMYDRVSIELQEALKQADQFAIDLKETEIMGKQWQDILASLTETDAELQLRKKREEPDE